MQTQMTTSKEIEKQERALKKQERALERAKVEYVSKQTDGITGALQTAQDSLHDVYSDYQYHSLSLDEKIKLLIKLDGIVGRVALVTAWQLGHELLTMKQRSSHFVSYIIEDLKWDYRRAARYMQIARAFNDRAQLDGAIGIGITTVGAAVVAARVIKKLRTKTKTSQTTLDIKAFQIEYSKSQLDPAEYEIPDNKEEINSYVEQTATAQTATTQTTAPTSTAETPTAETETAETPTTEETATGASSTVIESSSTASSLAEARDHITTQILPIAEGIKDYDLGEWQIARTVALQCIAALTKFVTLTTLSKDHSNADVPRSIDMDTSGMDSLDAAK